MQCDWLFIKRDHSKIEVTMQEPATPNPSDGKWHNDVGYKVVYRVDGRTTRPDIPLIIAVEL
jgi:hypothetical protein